MDSLERLRTMADRERHQERAVIEKPNGQRVQIRDGGKRAGRNAWRQTLRSVDVDNQEDDDGWAA